VEAYPSVCRSSVKQNDLSPVWNEVWCVKNVPKVADITIDVMDKDDGVTDDYIGTAKASLQEGARELKIEGPILKLRRSRGTFWIKARKPLIAQPLSDAS